MSVNFTVPTDIDPNVWYHITEFRVDTYGKTFTSNFHVNGDGELRVFGILEKQMWQFHPVDPDEHPGRYSLRHNFMGVYKQLAVCYDATEASTGKTKPCLMDSVPDEQHQMWDVADWGDGMVRFINVGNGTDYWLDVHQGNPPFMSSDTDPKADNPAQRWLYTSVSNVNDAAYSTVFSAEGSKPSTPRPSESSSTSSTESSSSQQTGSNENANEESVDSSSGGGLSPAAAAGAGAASGIAIVAIGILIFWLCRRSRKNKRQVNELPASGMGGTSPEKLASPAWSQDQQHQQYNQQTYFQQPTSAVQYDPHQPQQQSAVPQQVVPQQVVPQQMAAGPRPYEMSTDPQPQEMASVRY